MHKNQFYTLKFFAYHHWYKYHSLRTTGLRD